MTHKTNYKPKKKLSQTMIHEDPRFFSVYLLEYLQTMISNRCWEGVTQYKQITVLL